MNEKEILKKLVSILWVANVLQHGERNKLLENIDREYKDHERGTDTVCWCGEFH